MHAPLRTRADQVRSIQARSRSEEHTSELQSPCNLVCRLLLEKKNTELARARALTAALRTPDHVFRETWPGPLSVLTPNLALPARLPAASSQLTWLNEPSTGGQ